MKNEEELKGAPVETQPTPVTQEIPVTLKKSEGVDDPEKEPSAALATLDAETEREKRLRADKEKRREMRSSKRRSKSRSRSISPDIRYSSSRDNYYRSSGGHHRDRDHSRRDRDSYRDSDRRYGSKSGSGRHHRSDRDKSYEDRGTSRHGDRSDRDFRPSTDQAKPSFYVSSGATAVSKRDAPFKEPEVKKEAPPTATKANEDREEGEL